MKIKTLSVDAFVSCYFVKRSSSSLVEDLKYFGESLCNFADELSDEQVLSILGQIEEVEQNIDEIKSRLVERVLG